MSKLNQNAHPGHHPQKSASHPAYRKRRRLLIYPNFQLRLIAANAAVIFATFGALAWQTHRSFEQVKELGDQLQLPVGHDFYRFVDLQEGTILTVVVAVFFCALVLSATVSLYLSYRLAGPMVRLKGFFRRISEAERLEIETLRFRKGDFFLELAPLINEAIDRLRVDGATATRPGEATGNTPGSSSVDAAEAVMDEEEESKADEADDGDEMIEAS